MSASKTNPSFLWRSAHGYTVLLWSLQIFSSRVERGTAQLLLPNSLTHGGLIRLPLVTGKEAHRRQRDLQETPQEEEGHPQQVDALYQGYGEHYVDLWCGTPPQRQTVIVATGTSGTSFPCSTCGYCGEDYHTDRLFNEKLSHSYHQLTCAECALGRCSTSDPSRVGSCIFGMSYTEGSSWQAVEGKDHCYIGGLHDKPTFDDGGHDDLDPEHASAFGFSVNFGCQTSATGLFLTQLADGVLGMDNAANSFWRQMYQAGKMQDEIFSLCYVRQSHSDRSGTEAGAMTLGGSDDRLHLTRMVFTKQEEVWGDMFGALLRKIYLREGDGGVSMNATRDDLRIVPIEITESTLNQGPVRIDSGTTDSYFGIALTQPFKAAWMELVNWQYSNSMRYISYNEMIQLPTIIIQFQGSESLNREVGDPMMVPNLAGSLDPDHPNDVVVAIPPQHYMERASDGSASYTPRFYMLESARAGSTIGANMLMGHDVLFDMKNRRIGWAESNCNYEQLVEEAGYGKNDNNPTPAAPVSPPVPVAPHGEPPIVPAPPVTPPSGSNTFPNSAPPRDKPSGSSASAADEKSEPGSCSSSFCGAVSLIVAVSIVAGLFLHYGSSWSPFRRSTYKATATEENVVSAELELQVTYRPTELV